MHHTGQHLSEDRQRTVDSCLECHRMCEETVTYCLQRGGEYAEQSLIGVLTDCADMCRVCADMMLRGSQFQADVQRLCAEVCRRCAEACERMAEAQMRACAQSCRKLASVAA